MLRVGSRLGEIFKDPCGVCRRKVSGHSISGLEKNSKMVTRSSDSPMKGDEMADKNIKIETGPRQKSPVPLVSSYRPKQCFERFWLDLVENHELRNEEDPFMLELARLGNDHEARGQAHIENNGKTASIECKERTTVANLVKMIEEARKSENAIIITDGSTRGEQLAQHATHELCENPSKVQLIWNAHLRPWRKTAKGYEWGGRSGKPDVLVRDAKRKNRWGWNPVDYKAHRVLEKTGKSRTWKISELLDHTNQSDLVCGGPFKESDAKQLAHYVEMLKFHDLDGNGWGGIVGTDHGDDKHVIIWVDLNEPLYDRGRSSAMEIYNASYAEARKVAETAAKFKLDNTSVQPVTRPEWKSECKTCVWREHCQERLVEQDDPTLLAGMTVKVARLLRDKGVDTIGKIARLDIATAMVLDEKVEELDTMVADARSMRQYANSPVGAAISSPDAKIEDVLVKQGISTVGALAALDLDTAKMPSGVSLVGHIDQARVVDYARRKKMTHIFRGRGVHAVCIPRGNVEIHTDMEEDGIIYCWGNYLAWRNPNGKLRTSYHAFVTFERTDAEEARVFAEYWAFLKEWQQKSEEKFGPDTYKVFHYTKAEDRCMRHLAKKHAGIEGVPSIEEIDAFLESSSWVDLYPLLTKSLVWPTDDHSLKSLAKYVRFMWRDSDPSGASSTLWYQKASDSTLTKEEREIWQTRILQYNEDDVMATAALVDFVDRFTKVFDPSKKLPPVEDLDIRYRKGALAKSI